LESKWRYNIAFFGRSHMGWELCARVPSTLNILCVVKESPTTWGLWRRDIPTFPESLVRFGGPFAIGPGDHFPFGVDVEPD